jgi:hypothetical protein
MAAYTCDVIRTGAGVNGDILSIGALLTDKAGAFTGRWFVAPPAGQKEMLAVALTAMTTGLPVVAALAEPPAEYSLISTLHVIKS